MAIKTGNHITISVLEETYNVILSNDSQTVVTNSSRVVTSATSFTTQVIVSRGTQNITSFTIGTISNNYGITVSKSGSTLTFSIAANTTITADNGKFTIPVTVDGMTINKVFTFSCSKGGVNGTNAKNIKISASGSIFKSNDGGTTYFPNTITLTPSFQGGLSYSKWQYSTNGGSSWTNVTSGSNGLTISSNVLSVSKSSALFTESVTSIVFKCISNDANYYDTYTVSRLIDAGEIVIGGRNLALNTKLEYSSAYTSFDGSDNRCPVLSSKVLTTGLKVGDKVTVSLEYEYTNVVAVSGKTPTVYIQGNGNVTQWTSGTFTGSKRYTITGSGTHNIVYTFEVTEAQLENSYWTVNARHDGVQSGSIKWRKFKVERGTVPTDWSPAPEDTKTYTDNLVADLQDQIDDRIQTYSQNTQPSWESANNEKHTGDLWYNPDTKETKRWSGTAWVTLQNKEAQDASALAQKKAQVFTGTTPTPPYYKGDLWFSSNTSKAAVLKTCITSRTTGSYTATDWVENAKYTDDTGLNNLEIGGINRFIKKTVTKGSWLNSSGVAQSDGGWGYSDYIDVSNWKNYVASGFTNLGNSPSTCFYNSSKTFVSGVASGVQNSQNSNRRTLAIPSGVKYMRFAFMLKDIDTLKIEKGTKPTDYSSAPEDIDEVISNTQTIKGIKSTVDSNNSSITGKVWQTDIKSSIDSYNTNTVTEIANRVSTTEQKLNSITTTVSDITVRNGQNLLEDTNKGKTGWRWNVKDGTYSLEDYTSSGIHCVKAICTTASSGWSVLEYVNVSRDLLTQGGTYTLSFDVYSTVGVSLAVHYKRSDAQTTCGTFGTTKAIAANTWTRFVGTSTFSSSVAVNDSYNVIYFYGFGSAGSYFIKNLKLELGGTASAWSRSDAEITKNITTAEQTSEMIKWVVSGGTNATNMSLTEDFISMVAKEIVLNGRLKLNGSLSINLSDNENSTSTTLKDQFDKINSTINSTVASEITNATNKLNTNINDTIGKLSDNLDAYKSTVASYLTFDNDGLTIGKNNSPFKTVIDEDSMDFKQNNNTIASISKDLLNISKASVGNLKIGGFEFSSWSDGTVCINWVGL